MTTSGSAGHDALISLLWELKAAWQARGGGEVLLTNLLLEKVELDRFLSEAGAADDPEIRTIVSRILAAQAALDGEPPPVAAALGTGPVTPVGGLSGAPARATASRFDTVRGGSVILASLLVSGAAIRSLWFEHPVPTPVAVAAVSPAPAREPVAAVPPASGSEVPALAAPAPTLDTSELVLRIHGSNTVGEELCPSLVEGFLRGRGATEIAAVPGGSPVEKTLLANLPDRNKPVAIEIHAHGSSTAFADLASDAADLGQSSRRIKPEEVASSAEKFGDLSQPGSEHVVALDGLAIVVHPQNPVASLSIDQIAGLFSGKLRDWSAVGGRKGPVTLYARDDVSGTWDTFKHLVLAPGKLELDAAARRFESSSELSDAVAGDASAIGFIGLPYVRRTRLVAVSSEPGGLALVPTAFTVGTEDYPLSRRLYLYSPAASSNEFLRDFVDFALSEAGQDVVRDVGFVSQNLVLERPSVSGDAPAGYRRTAGSAGRLSLNFRFESGSENLDAKAIRDLDRVLSFLIRDRSREVLLLGFTDDRGDSRANVQLSRKRAEVVAKALESRGVFSREVHGFGEALPVASNSSDEGRNRNRRVEVWIR